MKGAQRLTQNTELAQIQKLSPQQVLYAKMLEMSSLELEDAVRKEMLENPAIENADSDRSDRNESEEYNDNDGGNDEEGHIEKIEPDTSMADNDGNYEDNDWNSDADIPAYRLNISNSSADDKQFEPVLTSGSSLFDYLSEQFNELDVTPKQRDIASYIIGNIDSNGYLASSVSAIADDMIFQMGMDVDEEEISTVLQLIRDLDPPGVAAVDLRDCLLLQLERLPGSQDTLRAYEMIDRYFDEFSKKHYEKIMAAMHLSKEEFQQMYNVIQTLNPKPGSLYESSDNQKSQHIVPDFSVEADDGTLTVTLLNNLPELQIAESFQALYDDAQQRKTRSSSQEKEDRYVKDKYESASAFIKMLRQRQETLFAIMKAIALWQKEFFLTEDETTLRPMVLKDIAEKTHFDISVISRATAGKYVMTGGTNYPLKFFFNEGLKHESGEDVSSREVQSILKELIGKEDKSKPISDEQLSQILQEKGYTIARRTVAKYREKLGIPVARLRKELK